MRYVKIFNSIKVKQTVIFEKDLTQLRNLAYYHGKKLNRLFIVVKKGEKVTVYREK